MTDYALGFTHRSAAERLRARAWFPLAGLELLRRVTSAADALDTSEAADFELGSSRNRDLARDFVRAVDHPQSLRLARAVELGIRLDLAFARGRECFHDLATTVAGAPDGRGALFLARQLDIVLGRERDRALGPRLDVRSAPALTVDLGLDRGSALDLELDHARERSQRLDAAHALAHALTVDLFRRYRGEVDEGAAERVRRQIGELGVLLDGVTAEVARQVVRRVRALVAMAASRDRDLVSAIHVAGADDLGAARPLLVEALTDAVGADLSGADLRRVPLVGVVWSSGTRWPQRRVAEIRESSERIGPDRFRVVGAPGARLVVDARL